MLIIIFFVYHHFTDYVKSGQAVELISLNFARKGALLLKSFGEDGFPPLSCLHQKNLTILVTNLPLLDRIWYGAFS